MPNPGSLFICQGPKTYAVSWRTENQIVNSSYHKNSPDIRFPGVPRTKSSILFTIRIHQIWWRVTGLPTTFLKPSQGVDNRQKQQGGYNDSTTSKQQQQQKQQH
jgi:hypothetical protein